MNDYREFIAGKFRRNTECGFDAKTDEYQLFPHQHALTKWAVRKGRAAIFADTGLGKTRMQLAWADIVHRKTGLDALILAPLAVAEQTRMEGVQMGIDVHHVRERSDVRRGINITNYDRLHKFDSSSFDIVVLDESSIIKHHDAKTLRILIDSFGHADYRLCATATPAPNDWAELGTHAEFLGICSRNEMLSEYFVHDGGETQKWRLKGHAKAEFWKWVSSWGAMLRTPADLSFDASAYDLPELHVRQITVESDAKALEGELFAKQASTLSERRQARRDSMIYRVEECAKMVNGSTAPWVIWCELNAEGDALRKAIPDAVEIKGSDTMEHKERSLFDFASGKIRVLATKPKIAGFGLNWQHCCNVAFIGAIDSFEAYYQAIRRCWRFGQTNEVNAYLFVSDMEGAVLANLKRKERDAESMFARLSAETSFAVRNEVLGQPRRHNEYNANQAIAIPLFMREENAA